MHSVAAVLRYLLARVPHSTQAEHDLIAAAIDEIEGLAPPAQPAKKE